MSLTPEEVELPPGARQKQPTLLGLGAALGVQVPSEYEDVELEPDDLGEDAADGAPASGSQMAGAEPASERSVQRGQATTTRAPSSGARADAVDATPVSPPTAEDVGVAVRRLADFALKLSIGPVSRLWVPEIRRASEVLLAIGKQRKEPTLALVSARLLGLLPAVAATSVAASASSAGSTSADAAGASAADADRQENVEPPSAGGGATPESRASAGATVEGDGTDGGTTEGEAVASDVGDAIASVERDTSSSSEPNASEPDVALDSLEGALREQMLHEVTRLAGLLPEWPAAAQDLAQETRRRETRLVRELLESVDGLRRDHRARLTEQMRLEELATLAPEVLAEEFETPVERATELSRVLGKYRQLRQRTAPDIGNTLGVERALAELERAQRGFEDCDPERKEVQRALRAERRQAMSGLCLQLAERGELEQLELLEPLSVAERIERMHQWLGTGAERPS